MFKANKALRSNSLKSQMSVEINFRVLSRTCNNVSGKKYGGVCKRISGNAAGG